MLSGCAVWLNLIGHDSVLNRRHLKQAWLILAVCSPQSNTLCARLVMTTLFNFCIEVKNTSPRFSIPILSGKRIVLMMSCTLTITATTRFRVTIHIQSGNSAGCGFRLDRLHTVRVRLHFGLVGKHARVSQRQECASLLDHYSRRPDY